MKRNFEVIFAEDNQIGFEPGDEAAHRAAAALADRADAPTIGALTDMLTFLERIGGQFHVTALRLESAPDAGDWETCGLAFNYETRDARVKLADAPEQVFNVPVTDSQAPATEVHMGDAEELAESLEEQPALSE